MQTLYELTTTLRLLDAAIEEAGEELTPDILDAIDRTEEDYKAKIHNYCLLIRNIEARETMCRDESKRLASRADIAKHQADRLKARVLESLNATNTKTIDTGLFCVSRAVNGGHLPVLVDVLPDQLPPEFQKIRVEVNSMAIRDALLSGTEVFGCRMGARGEHLRIK